jgi:hypothetical protein
MALNYKSTLPLRGIAIPLFGVFLGVAFELMLQLQALLSLSLSLGISLVLPTVSLALAITLQLIAQFTIAIGFGLPDFSLNLSLAFSFELSLILGFVAVLQGLLSAVAGVSLVAYGWFGPGNDFGGAVSGAVSGGWPDGTPSSQNVTAYLLVATSSGPYTPDQVEAVVLVASPAAPPTPTSPPPPAGTPFPPPQCYEAGLASVVIAAPPPGGTQATATLSVDNSIATGIGAVTGVTIVAHGSGYTTAPAVTISDSASIVSATSSSPIVVTLPRALAIPIGHVFGVTVAGVEGSTDITDATAASPIVVTVADTTGLATASILPGSYGLEGLNGLWFAKVTGPTTAELWMDAAFTIPSSGTGSYTGAAKLAGNVCGLRYAKVITPTTVELYSDSGATDPVVGFGGYTPGTGTATGGGSGAAATCTMGGGATNALKSLFSGITWPSVEGLAGGVISFSVMISVLFELMVALLGNLQARASLLGAASASVSVLPPSVSASITILTKIEATLRANLTATLPSLSASASAALSAQINAIASLSAQIGFFVGMGNVELEIWEYTGPGAGLGGAISAGPGTAGWHDATAPTVPVVVGVVGLTSPASLAAFGAFFSGI